jgi:hypothetical protein
MPRKLVSPAQAERLLKRAKRSKSVIDRLADYYDKVSSGTTIAPDSDVRPEIISDPATAFAALPPATD